MNYTLDDLIGFIARHDEHEGYYREQLEALIQEREAKAWDEGFAHSVRTNFHSRMPRLEDNPYRKEKDSAGD